MHWDSRKDEEYRMVEVLVSDIGNKTLGHVSIKDGAINWQAAYVDEVGVEHNLGVYRDFGMAKQIVEDRVNARAG